VKFVAMDACTRIHKHHGVVGTDVDDIKGSLRQQLSSLAHLLATRELGDTGW